MQKKSYKQAYEKHQIMTPNYLLIFLLLFPPVFYYTISTYTCFYTQFSRPSTMCVVNINITYYYHTNVAFTTKLLLLS